jgi:hypothetical protein
LASALAGASPALLHLRLPTDVITSRTTLTAIRAKSLAERAAAANETSNE